MLYATFILKDGVYLNLYVRRGQNVKADIYH